MGNMLISIGSGNGLMLSGNKPVIGFCQRPMMSYTVTWSQWVNNPFWNENELNWSASIYIFCSMLLKPAIVDEYAEAGTLKSTESSCCCKIGECSILKPFCTMQNYSHRGDTCDHICFQLFSYWVRKATRLPNEMTYFVLIYTVKSSVETI